VEIGIGEATVIGAVIGAVAVVVAAAAPYYLSRRRMSDRDLFWRWRDAFDRRAFKGPFEMRSDPAPFAQAINDLLRAISTGRIVISLGPDREPDVVTSEGIGHINNPE
jgi:hypothetical protein